MRQTAGFKYLPVEVDVPVESRRTRRISTRREEMGGGGFIASQEVTNNEVDKQNSQNCSAGIKVTGGWGRYKSQ